jgi:hypothetical protein
MGRFDFVGAVFMMGSLAEVGATIAEVLPECKNI